MIKYPLRNPKKNPPVLSIKPTSLFFTKFANFFVRNEKNKKKIRKVIKYERPFEINKLLINLLIKFINLSPKLYVPNNAIIQLIADRISWEKPRKKERPAEIKINPRIKRSTIR